MGREVLVSRRMPIVLAVRLVVTMSKRPSPFMSVSVTLWEVLFVGCKIAGAKPLGWPGNKPTVLAWKLAATMFKRPSPLISCGTAFVGAVFWPVE